MGRADTKNLPNAAKSAGSCGAAWRGSEGLGRDRGHLLDRKRHPANPQPFDDGAGEARASWSRLRRPRNARRPGLPGAGRKGFAAAGHQPYDHLGDGWRRRRRADHGSATITQFLALTGKPQDGPQKVRAARRMDPRGPDDQEAAAGRARSPPRRQACSTHRPTEGPGRVALAPERRAAAAGHVVGREMDGRHACAIVPSAPARRAPRRSPVSQARARSRPCRLPCRPQG